MFLSSIALTGGDWGGSDGGKDKGKFEICVLLFVIAFYLSLFVEVFENGKLCYNYNINGLHFSFFVPEIRILEGNVIKKKLIVVFS